MTYLSWHCIHVYSSPFLHIMLVIFEVVICVNYVNLAQW